MRAWNIPNAITIARILLIVVFGYLLMTHRDGWAIAVLALAGISDFLDGYLARKWNQATELGRILDPAADRILTVVVVLGLAIRDIIPWWLVVFLLARDVVVGVALLVGRRRGIAAPQVTFIGKTATFVLYFALPLAYLAFERWDTVHMVAIVVATLAGALYWASGIGYVRAVLSGEHSGDSPTDENQQAHLE